MTGLRNNPGLKQTDELLAVVHIWIISLCIELFEYCVFVCVPTDTEQISLVMHWETPF